MSFIFDISIDPNLNPLAMFLKHSHHEANINSLVGESGCDVRNLFGIFTGNSSRLDESHRDQIPMTRPLGSRSTRHRV